MGNPGRTELGISDDDQAMNLGDDLGYFAAAQGQRAGGRSAAHGSGSSQLVRRGCAVSYETADHRSRSVIWAATTARWSGAGSVTA